MDIIAKSKSNIWKLYVISFLGGFAFFYNSIETLYYRHFGLSFQQIGILISASMLMSIILNIPTGAFADIYGRKKSLLIGSLCSFIALSFVAFGSSFILFLIGFLFWGVSLAFNTGASTALLYDSLKNLEEHTLFTKHTGRLSSLFISIDIISGATGPLLFMTNVRLPYIISWASVIAVIIFQFSLFEKIPDSQHKENPLKENYIQMLNSLKVIKRSKILIWLTAFSLIFFAINRVFSEMLVTPFLIHVGYTLSSLSVMSLIGNPLQVSSAFFADKFEKKLGDRKSFILLVLGIPLSLIFFSLSRNIILSGVFIGLYYSLGSFREIITASYMNHNIDSENRATLLSISSTIVSFFTVISLPLFGLLTDKTSLGMMLWVISAFVLVFGGMLLLKQPFRANS